MSYDYWVRFDDESRLRPFFEKAQEREGPALTYEEWLDREREQLRFADRDSEGRLKDERWGYRMSDEVRAGRTT